MATPVDEKISELTKLLGPEMMQDVLLTVIQKEKMAEQSGFVAKEAKSLDDMTPEEIIEYGLAKKERQEQEAKEKEAKESSMADEMKAMREEMKGHMEKMNQFIGQMAGKKPASSSEEEEDEKKKEDAPVAAVTKEALPDPQTDTILKAINAQTAVLKELKGRVDLIEKAWQEAPPAIRSGGRPSQSSGNVLNGVALTEKEAQGQTNGMEGSYNGLIDFIVPKPGA